MSILITFTSVVVVALGAGVAIGYNRKVEELKYQSKILSSFGLLHTKPESAPGYRRAASFRPSRTGYFLLVLYEETIPNRAQYRFARFNLDERHAMKPKLLLTEPILADGSLSTSTKLDVAIDFTYGFELRVDDSDESLVHLDIHINHLARELKRVVNLSHIRYAFCFFESE